MFDRLSTRLEEVFKRLRSRGTLSETDIDLALKDVRLALLEADVHFKVVKAFLEKVRLKAIGERVQASLTPGQQVVKIVWEELKDLMGGEAGASPVRLSPNPPTVLMLVGLQGAGKTTTAAKLALQFKGKGRRVLLAAADVKRPAAVEQLVSLGRGIGVEVRTPSDARADALSVCGEAVQRGRDGGFDLVILDTAGRLHIDGALMEELSAVKDRVKPHESLLVVDAMTGQDAVQIGQRFHEAVGLDGVILTKLDGDARGGALLSIRSVTGLPVKYIGTGEKTDGLEPFHPERMASRILGMGDVLTLIERAGEAIDKETALKKLEGPGKKGFTLEDFRDQIRQVKKMGSLESVLGMLPGGRQLKEAVRENAGSGEKELVKVEAIINSMTAPERRDPTILNGSRRKRIATGSGTTVQDVNRLLRQFLEAKKLMKSLSRGKGAGIGRLLKTF
jgi:signal recognition particle subunit SRP54